MDTDALLRNPTNHVPTTVTLPIRKRGCLLKTPFVQPPLVETQSPGKNLRIDDRVKLRRKAEERPLYSYSSDDEMDLCNVSKRKRVFKKKTRKRIGYRKIPPIVAEIEVISLPP